MKNYLNNLLTEKNYLKLASTVADEHMLNTIETLKEEYISTLTKSRMFLTKESVENLNHSEQSETLGKIVMLCHEYGGTQMVIRTINELSFKIHDLAVETILKLEQKLEEKK